MGDRLGRYTLLKRLAVGGMGEVFVAAKSGPVGFGPYVALKVLRDELAVDQQFVDMLVDEANITKHLNHQNLVSVLDLGEDGGSYYIAMEFVQGITTERLIESLVERQRKLDIPLALHIGVELCKALKYAHSRTNEAGEPLGIVHRDVTPANVLLSTQGEVKLTDFGIARAKGRVHQTQAGVLKGKFGYMAPEMVRYEALDARADLFCAGVALYLLAAGRHPVAHASVMEAIQRYETKRIARPSEANPEITPALDEVLMKALEPKPAERWQSASELGEALQQILLSNPEWRSHARDASTLLSRRIREVAPEVFGEIVPRETLARLAAELPDEPLLPSSPFGPSVEPPPASSSRPGAPPAGPLPVRSSSRRATADVETDESLPYDDVRRAREQLAVAADPAVDSDGVPSVSFPDSSTDPNRVARWDQRLEEPMLPHPTEGLSLPVRPEVVESDLITQDRTVAGMEWSEPSIDRTISSEDDDEDGATVVGVSVDGVEGAPNLLDEDTLGTGSIEPDPPTVIPLDGPAVSGDENPSANRRRDAQFGGSADSLGSSGESSASSPFASEADVWGTDSDPGATLLEGLDANAVREAIGRLPSEVPLDRTLADDFNEYDDPNQATYVRMVVDPADPSEEQRDDLAPLDGPIRIVLGADGAPALATRSPGVGAPLPEIQGIATGQPGSAGLDVGTDTGLWIAGALGADSLEWGDDAAGRRAVATRNQAFKEEISGSPETSIPQPSLLSFAPGRGAPYPSPNGGPSLREPAPLPNAPAVNMPPDGVRPEAWRQAEVPQPGFLERQGPLLGVMGLTVVLAGTLSYVWFFTELLWPKLQIETLPPAAKVKIDGQEQLGRTPMMVKVEPGRRHRIELRVDGYAPALREITEGIGRGRTYALEVTLDRTPPTLHIGPVPGAVVLNGETVGSGRRVRLSSVPSEGQVRIRVEADGYEPYEVIFESAEAIPSSLDIPLEPRSKS